MVSNIKISVVIPLYNKSYSIVRCLQSVISQTVLPDEIIIVNDGSTDDGLAVLNRFLQKLNATDVKIVVLDHQNQGVSAARNNGVSQSESNYVAFLDADDEWLPDYLKNILSCIKINPSLPFYSCRHEFCLEGLCFVPPQHFSDDVSDIGKVDNYFKRACVFELVNSSKVVISKPVFEEVGGFPEGANLCEDLYLWARLSEVGHLGFTNYVGARINQVADSSRFSRNNAQPYILQYYFKHPDRITDELRAYLWTVYRNHLILSILNGNLSEYMSRWKFGRQIFKPESYFLLVLALIPSKLIHLLKKARSLLLKVVL